MKNSEFLVGVRKAGNDPWCMKCVDCLLTLFGDPLMQRTSSPLENANVAIAPKLSSTYFMTVHWGPICFNLGFLASHPLSSLWHRRFSRLSLINCTFRLSMGTSVLFENSWVSLKHNISIILLKLASSRCYQHLLLSSSVLK